MRRALAAVIGTTMMLGTWSAAHAGGTSTWYMTNAIACTGPQGNQVCGPPNEMKEGSGNGTFPTGFALIKVGERRVWIADHAAGNTRSLAMHEWTLTLGVPSVVTGLTWTVGSWNWASGSFTAASGAETPVDAPGTSTFTPTVPFIVPSGDYLALGITGDEHGNLISVRDPLEGDSPSFLTGG